MERIDDQRITLVADAADRYSAECALVVAPWFLYDRLLQALAEIEAAPLALTLFGKQPHARTATALASRSRRAQREPARGRAAVRRQHDRVRVGAAGHRQDRDARPRDRRAARARRADPARVDDERRDRSDPREARDAAVVRAAARSCGSGAAMPTRSAPSSRTSSTAGTARGATSSHGCARASARSSSRSGSRARSRPSSCRRCRRSSRCSREPPPRLRAGALLRVFTAADAIADLEARDAAPRSSTSASPGSSACARSRRRAWRRAPPRIAMLEAPRDRRGARRAVHADEHVPVAAARAASASTC